MTLTNVLSRHKLVIVLCVLVGVAAGFGASRLREPQYTSTATASAGKLDVISQAVPGFVQGAESLASTYSRIATSDAITQSVAKRTGVPQSAVQDSVTAVPLPDSPVFRIIAESPDPQQSRALANATLTELTAFVERLTRGSDDQGPLIDRYLEYNRVAERLRREISREERRLARRKITTGSRELSGLKVRLAAVELRAQSVAQTFTSQRQASTGAVSITTLSRASAPASDDRSFMQRFILAGLVGGAALGLLIAFLLEQRRRPEAAPAEYMPLLLSMMAEQRKLASGDAPPPDRPTPAET